jgi:hypothetical protein
MPCLYFQAFLVYESLYDPSNIGLDLWRTLYSVNTSLISLFIYFDGKTSLTAVVIIIALLLLHSLIEQCDCPSCNPHF